MGWRRSSTKPVVKALIEYGEDFAAQRTALAAGLQRLVDDIEESLRAKPTERADHQLLGADDGTMLARRKGGVYVAFQKHINTPPPPFRLRLWYCGTYRESRGDVVYDFEDE